MMKLKRVYETATDENKPVEEVALERYGSLEAFEEAKEERRILDEQDGRRTGRGGFSSPDKDEFGRDIRRDGGDSEKRGREERFMFTDVGGSGSSSRSSSFRRPGQSAPSTPSPGTSSTPLPHKRLDSLRLPSQVGKSPLSASHTPIPSVMTPPARSRDNDKPSLNQSELNKLQAKVLRAKLMGSSEAARLEKEYEEESRRASSGYLVSSNQEEHDSRGRRIEKKVEVLPTLDGRGRLYDVGTGGGSDSPVPGNRKKKEEKVMHVYQSLTAFVY